MLYLKRSLQKPKGVLNHSAAENIDHFSSYVCHCSCARMFEEIACVLYIVYVQIMLKNANRLAFLAGKNSKYYMIIYMYISFTHPVVWVSVIISTPSVVHA